ncbi:DUF5658 family protein [Stieleria sp. TO1_6]|uniref:DUF5658 family protein n=1 Tax=Stieleria tagensis TaxID=2956795 RepID=UPI00209A661D|nr:DUF5658 family protein [Stieleria tagensis]MCO8124977.1 DUF5658 family protein [Stieleria tagensis]
MNGNHLIKTSISSLRVLVACGAALLAFSCTVGWSQTAKLVPRPPAGYLFIDSEYIAPPYQFKFSDETLTINGREFTKDSFDLSQYETSERDGRGGEGRGWEGRGWDGRGWNERGRDDRDWDERGSRGRGRMTQSERDDSRFGRSGDEPEFRRVGYPGFRRPQRTPLARLCDDIETTSFGTVTVLYTGGSPLFVSLTREGYDLLKTLSGHQSVTSISNDTSSQIPTELRNDTDVETWNRLVHEFQPTESFLSRATTDLERLENAAVDGDRVISAGYWMNKISYPLTVFAMVVVVLGFGHLLSNRPNIEKTAGDNEQDDWLKQRRVVGQSLLIVGLLSAVDLIWTIGTANAGLMRELNPLGSGLIDQPVLLFLFKTAVTTISIAILYSLHRRPVAQVASWWCCLLLTLLTARWVVFQSMFL